MQKQPPSAPTKSRPNRKVNDLLHSLRGEDFRHSRNLNQAHSPLKVIPPAYTVPKQTLPLSDIFGHEADQDWGSGSPHASQVSSADDRTRPAWRDQALSLLLSDPATQFQLVGNHDVSFVTPLTELCLRLLLANCSSIEFAQDLVPHLPPHLRRVLLRWTAVHAPLNNLELYALCDPEVGGHADGELIVVGPRARLPDNYFETVAARRLAPNSAAVRGGHDYSGDEDAMNQGNDNWESRSSSHDDSSPLVLLGLVLTPLSASMLLTLPPTITHLALLSLPTLVPVHRLPRLLPLLEVLDLSYNPWLSQPRFVSGEQGKENLKESFLDRTEWGRWSQLRVLGLRDCEAKEGVITRVNGGRWVDVTIVGVERSVAT